MIQENIALEKLQDEPMSGEDVVTNGTAKEATFPHSECRQSGEVTASVIHPSAEDACSRKREVRDFNIMAAGNAQSHDIFIIFRSIFHKISLSSLTKL